jgi:hypothetical protein
MYIIVNNKRKKITTVPRTVSAEYFRGERQVKNTNPNKKSLMTIEKALASVGKSIE